MSAERTAANPPKPEIVSVNRAPQSFNALVGPILLAIAAYTSPVAPTINPNLPPATHALLFQPDHQSMPSVETKPLPDSWQQQIEEEWGEDLGYSVAGVRFFFLPNEDNPNQTFAELVANPNSNGTLVLVAPEGEGRIMPRAAAVAFFQKLLPPVGVIEPSVVEFSVSKTAEIGISVDENGELYVQLPTGGFNKDDEVLHSVPIAEFVSQLEVALEPETNSVALTPSSPEYQQENGPIVVLWPGIAGIGFLMLTLIGSYLVKSATIATQHKIKQISSDVIAKLPGKNKNQ